MNSIRIKDRLQRAWLKVTKVCVPKEGHVTLRGEMFDGTIFDFTVPNHEYEDQGGDVPPLIEVGLVGNLGSAICEIILPAPSLHHGHNIRVSESSLLRWDFYNTIKEKNEAAKRAAAKA